MSVVVSDPLYICLLREQQGSSFITVLMDD